MLGGQNRRKVLTESRGPIRIVRLNRPAVHNAIDRESAALLRAAVQAFAEQEDAAALVVTGSAESFSSGADLAEIESLMRRSATKGEPPLGFSDLDPGKPTIAAVEGHCLGGGLELAVWCDIVVAGAGATFGAVNRRAGVPWLDGGTQRLARRVGIGHALYLIETGEVIDAARALAMGLVQEVTEPGGAFARAMALAERIASYPQRSLVADRRSTLSALGVPLEEGLRSELRAGQAAALDGELAAGVSRFRDRAR
jgi:enoyl-CoA hydratase